MNEQGYSAVNSEQTIFMKWDGEDFIIHELFAAASQHRILPWPQPLRNLSHARRPSQEAKNHSG